MSIMSWLNALNNLFTKTQNIEFKLNNLIFIVVIFQCFKYNLLFLFFLMLHFS